MAAMPRPSTSSRSTEAVLLELEGLAMGGLVAILRQLGDLAELAAEVLDGLQDQATAVSARARRLTARAKQLQADLDHQLPPSIIRHLLCQAHTRTLTQRQQHQCLNKVSHGVITVVVGEAPPPRSIVNHIKRCRGPPRLSALDRFDAHGDGACLKRYTDPSFFRTAHSENACSANLLHQADSDDTKSQADDSEKQSLGFLSLLRRQLKHRQTAGSVSPTLKIQQMRQTCTRKSSAERRDSSADHSGTDTSSPGFDDMELDKANRNRPSMSNCCSDSAGSDYVGSCSELQRTSSFEAWLSPGARFSAHDEYETTQESSPPTCSRFVSHAGASNGPLTDDTMEAKQDSAAAEASCNKGSVSRRHRYKGSIASRVTSLPRKLCLKQQHGPLADSSRSRHTDTGGLRSKSNGGTEEFVPVLVADAVFSVQDSVPESEERYSHQETTRLQRTGCQSHDDSSADAEKHDQQNGPSISNQCSNSSSPENSGEPTYTPDAAKDVLFPRMQRTGCETDKSLHTKLTSALLENTNSCSEDTKVDTPPLLAIPPMQWLSVKVHTGPIPSYRKPFGKDHVKRAGGKILKTTELSGLAIHSYQGWSGAEIHSQQEPRQQLATADADRDMEVTDRPTEKVTEDHQVSYREGAEMSSCGGNTVSDSKANKHSNATQVDVQSSATGQGGENVFFSAVEQLARMSPPWIPRPKHPLPEVASCDRITLRNGPSPIHGSRSILDCRTILVEQIKDKPFSLKPVSGTSSPVSVTTGSPTNILQRADDMRQAHADSNDLDGENSWSYHSD